MLNIIEEQPANVGKMMITLIKRDFKRTTMKNSTKYALNHIKRHNYPYQTNKRNKTNYAFACHRA